MDKQAAKAIEDQERVVLASACELAKRVKLYRAAKKKLEACEQRMLHAQGEYDWEVYELGRIARGEL